MPGIIKFEGRKLHLMFIIVGCGANGSHFFRGLCQDLRTHLNKYIHQPYDRPFSYEHVLLIDGDISPFGVSTITPSNSLQFLGLRR
jgi:hypothetical protein